MAMVRNFLHISLYFLCCLRHCNANIDNRLFLVEAIATILVGIAIWFLLPDCTRIPFQAYATRLMCGGTVPETASWLTDKEKAFIQARLPQNAPRSAEQDFNLGEIWSSLKDIRLWLFTLIWALFTVGTSGVRFYQPTVIANLGFTCVIPPFPSKVL